MNIENILRELMAKRDRINGAIGALSASGAVAKGKVRKVRGPLSEETKQKMRDSWARRRKLKAKGKP